MGPEYFYFGYFNFNTFTFDLVFLHYGIISFTEVKHLPLLQHEKVWTSHQLPPGGGSALFPGSVLFSEEEQTGSDPCVAGLFWSPLKSHEEKGLD